MISGFLQEILNELLMSALITTKFFLTPTKFFLTTTKLILPATELPTKLILSNTQFAHENT